MAGTFDEFLRWPDRQVTVLAVFAPHRILIGWDAVGGATPNTYRIALPSALQTERFAGGVFQRCVGVTLSDARLVSRASIALVEANPGSWYWDQAAGLLYARSATGGAPDTFEVAFASVELYASTNGVVLNDVDGDPNTAVYYWPWLDGNTPHLSSEVEDLLSGQKITESGSVTLTNGHGFWHTIAAPDGDYWWKNTKVRIYIGGSYNGLELDRSQYVAFKTMLVEDVATDEERCEFKLSPLSRATERTLPVTPIFGDNLGSGVSGTKKWIGYGRATIAPDLTDTTGLGVWTVADAAFQTLFAVHSVYAVPNGGVAIALSGSDYTVDLVDCTVTITNATYAWQEYGLQVEVTGKPKAGGGYLSTFADIVEDLLRTFVGAQDEDIDAAAFLKANEEAPEELSVWLKSPRTLASILSTSEPGLPCIERSVMGTVQQTAAGVWTCWIWDPSYDEAVTVAMQKEDFASFSPQPKLEALFGTVNAYYGFVPAREEWFVTSSTDARTGYLAGPTDSLEVYTFLRSELAAQTLAQRYRLMAGAVSTEVDFSERGGLLARKLAGDKVLVTYDPAPSRTGSWDSQPFQILRLSVSWAPTLVITGRLGSLRGIGPFLRHWTADDAPDWADASAAERGFNIFWADDDGFVEPGNPASKDIWIWI